MEGNSKENKQEKSYKVKGYQGPVEAGKSTRYWGRSLSPKSAGFLHKRWSGQIQFYCRLHLEYLKISSFQKSTKIAVLESVSWDSRYTVCRVFHSRYKMGYTSRYMLNGANIASIQLCIIRTIWRDKIGRFIRRRSWRTRLGTPVLTQVRSSNVGPFARCRCNQR